MVKKVMLVASFKSSGSGLKYLESLRERGYDPLCFDMKEESEKVFNRTRNALINTLVNPYVNKILNNRLLSLFKKYKPDLLLVQNNLSVDPEIIDEIKSEIVGHLHMFNRNFKIVEELLQEKETLLAANN